jgi:hypothetical protein
MVAKVISGKTIRRALSYNENKVAEGTATCILASKFGSEPDDLSFYTKLYRFQNLMQWNPKTKTNTLHISLNFDKTENPPVDVLREISSTYMNKIGFGDQPYLVYQHFDAAHPHIHILTTNIQSDGKRIDIHNIGRNKSEKARQEIEKLFNLVKADERKKKSTEVKPINVGPALYGKSETKRSISNAVKLVAKYYRFTSFPEYNAALRQFNVVADRGTEGMNMYSKKGLRYSLLDAKGNQVGIPIKASLIDRKAMLPHIEKQFKLNDAIRRESKEVLKEKINTCLDARTKISSGKFHQALQAKSVYVLLRLTATGEVHGITFVDNETKCVFNGSDLGKDYSAKGISERISDLKYPKRVPKKNWKKSSYTEKPVEIKLGFGEFLKDVVTATPTDFTSPEVALRVKRRRRRRGRRI